MEYEYLEKPGILQGGKFYSTKPIVRVLK